MEPAQQHKGETRRAVKKQTCAIMCIKGRISDDFKGQIVACFFLLRCFMNSGKETWYLFPFFRYFAFVILVVVMFFLCIFHFSWPFRIVYYIMFQWCHIDSECWFISNNLNRIHSHLKWPIMSNDSDCDITDFGPFGSFRILSDHAAFTRSCRVAWNAAVKPLSWGSFTTALPLKWWISWGKSGRTSMKERVKNWGKGGEKHGKP